MLLSYSRVRFLLLSRIIITITLGYMLIIIIYHKPASYNTITQPTSRLNRVNTTNYHLSWIVVTSTNPPTKEIARLAQQKHFQLLVVGDQKSPKNWAYPNTIFLSTSDQQELGYSILESTPSNSYNRKNIGYLFALQNRAQFITTLTTTMRPLLALPTTLTCASTTTALC